MTLAQRLKEYISACFTGLWIESHEHEDALVEIAELCRAENWSLAVWDLEQGLRRPGAAPSPAETGAADPLAAVRALAALAVPQGTALLVLVNFHRFLASAEVVQALAQQLTAGKQQRTFIVVLAPLVQIPHELAKQFLVIEHELPSRVQLLEIVQALATEAEELPGGPALERVLDAACGLTRYEAEGAFSLSLVRHGCVQPEVVWELKSQLLKKSGLLSLHRGRESFAGLGGLSALKAFCLRALRHPSQTDPLRRPRGVLLLSPPGCGKSKFSKGAPSND